MAVDYLTGRGEGGGGGGRFEGGGGGGGGKACLCREVEGVGRDGWMDGWEDSGCKCKCK